MIWRIRNVMTKVEPATPDEEAWLREYLSVTRKTYSPYAGKYKTVQVSLLDHAREFPTGLARAAWRAAQTAGIHVDIIDERAQPCLPDGAADLEWLRHHPAVQGEITHQIEAVQAVMKHKRGIVWVPTGGGKTCIAIGIAQALPCRWLFVVHRADLLHQTVARYNQFAGVPAGTIGDGEMDVPPGCRFVVATFQTIHSAIRRGNENVLEIIKQAEGLIVDEVHVVSADTYLRVTREAENAYYRVGLSGTPLAKDAERNLRVIGGLGPVIYRVRPEELIAKGLLARPAIRMMQVSQCCERATWTGVYGEAIVRSRERNAAVVEAVRRAAKPCLVFVQQIKHGRHLEERLHRAGVAVEFVWGEDDTRERRAAIERLVRSQSEVLVCNVIFQEGIDIPSLASVVVATGGASPVAAIQRIGRGMRADAATDKSTFEVWDFADQGCGCDGAHTGCRWIERHARERAKAYRAEGFEVAVIPEAAKQLEIEAA